MSKTKEEAKEMFFRTIDLLIENLESTPVSYEALNITSENWEDFKKEYIELKTFVNGKTVVPA